MIVEGPDGALWFTENQGNKIGRISTSGEIAEYHIPTPASGPVGITKGADGALWFVEISGNKIGKITTAGEITEYPIPTANAKPHAITPGKDRDLWFTEWGSNQIGRITLCGKITEYKIPTTNSEPHGIVLAQDGGSWFAEESNKIGQNVTIMPGIKVGDGAIIAANSTVVKNIEPYTICGGNPAKFIKKRFSDEKIEFLLKLQWWNWDESRIFDSLEMLVSGDRLDQLVGEDW